MNRKICVLLLIVLLFNGRIYAQAGFWKTKEAYLGQEQPGEIPRIFAKGLLVDSGFAFCRVAFSNAGKEFLYTFGQSWTDYKGSGVNRIVFDGKQWEKPELLFVEYSKPTLSPDGQTLYLDGKGGVLWRSEKTADGWSRPVQYLDLPFGLYNYMPTLSGTVYAGSNGTWGKKGDYNSYQFSVFRITGKDTVIKSLGTPLNKPGFNGDLYIAPDESYIIISTNETPAYESELYISFRKKNKTWTKPVSLGAAINEGKAHRYGQYVSPDGKYLFYTQGTSEKDCHIYWMRFDGLLKRLKAAAEAELQ
ncbi:hypothetical protein A8C56_00385 [Niabella ginsenosidivorans]|uniref:Uncharacterized protein n=1 Tax=Niabella ginsenosidivorans TaxID=1176587 RepID=A0A1A9HZ87_9BACT|nr:hypothetical protein [Niabella ginsenosidivorans]ANH79634.1 hypothetical protein A8C56_00385 [Niabella ginsenosidivorans]